MEVEQFDLGHGVRLRSIYAHLMSPCLMAFARAEPGKPHPAPWRAAKGGFGYDIEVEISVPRGVDLPGNLSPEDAIWWIASLLRLGAYPYLLVPALADAPFDAHEHDEVPNIRPHETQPRLFSVANPGTPKLSLKELNWVAEKWASRAGLLADRRFRLAVTAIDACATQGKFGASLLAAVGALEQLFQPDRGELRYRLASNVAAFAEPPGEARLNVYKRMLTLYDKRSRAAHSAADVEPEPLVEAFVIGRNALVKMVDRGSIPSTSDFERLLFCGESDATDDVDGRK